MVAMPEFCPTCGVSTNPIVFTRRTRYAITPLGRAVLDQMRKGEPMPKCSRCGAPTLLGFVDGDKPILCAPCEQVMAEEREPVR